MAQRIHGITGKVIEDTEIQGDITGVEVNPFNDTVSFIDSDGIFNVAQRIEFLRAHRCTKCGVEIPPNDQPVTVSGWYNGHEFVLVNLRAELRDVRCPAHR